VAILTLFEEFADDIGSSEHDLGTDVLKVGLVTSVAAVAASDTTPAWGDYSANEVSGTGYSAGGAEITNDTYTEADGIGTLDGDDVSWSYNAAGFTDARYAVLYNSSHASDRAIGFVDFGEDVSLRDGDVSLRWGSSGILIVEIWGAEMQDGVYYVSVNGNDSWSGKSWARPKATIAAAIALLNDAYPAEGGKIYLDQGRHDIDELAITTPGVHIQGASPSATQLLIDSAATYGIKASGAWRLTVTDLMICCENGFEGRAIWLDDDSDWCVLDRVWFHYIGHDYTGDVDVDTDPCCIYLRGITDWCDWHKFTNCEFWNCYRGIVSRQQANSTLMSSTMRNMIMKCVHVGESSSAHGIVIDGCWFAGQSGTETGYMIELTGSGGFSNTRISNCQTELHNNDVKDHIRCDARNVVIANHYFGGGGSSGDTPVGLYLDTNSRGCVVSNYRRSGTGGGPPAILDYGSSGSNQIWPGDWEDTPSAMADTWSATASKTITADTTSGDATTYLTANRPVKVGKHIVNVDTITDDDTVVLTTAVTVSGATVYRLNWDLN